MKIIVNIARVLVGCLFIFSGLVKAIDPLGLAYKMQEFFEVWAASGYLKGMMDLLYDQALLFSVLMIALEVLLGVALLLGWRLKPVSWFLLALTLFFTFLTSYVLFSGKIRACGCFGDCIPLTPVQTFTKDLVLLLLVLIILLFGRYVRPLFPPKVNGWLVMGSLLAVAGLQWYVLRHLPVVDCLPFRSGNNILELRKMPKDAVPDKYDYVFVYSKNGEKKEFRVNALPDSTWVFVERKQTLVQKGKNNIPLINDFILKTQDGTDTTEAILNTPGTYYLLFIKDFPGAKAWRATTGYMQRRDKGIPHFIVTAQPALMDSLFRKEKDHAHVAIVSCDGVAIKTAARANPTLYQMNGPVIVHKWSWVDFDRIKLIGGFKSLNDTFK